MESVRFHELVRAIPYGKIVNSALYLYRSTDADLGSELNTLLQQLAIAYAIPPQFNVLKFRLNDAKLSFLSYPDFLVVAHPVLREALTIDLTLGKSRKIDYSDQPNPPILHRRETLLPRDHENWHVFH